MTGEITDAAGANRQGPGSGVQGLGKAGDAVPQTPDPKPQTPFILTPSEVCSMLRIRTRRPQASIQNLARRHGLRVLRVGRRVVVQREDLESWLIRNAGTEETGTE